MKSKLLLLIVAVVFTGSGVLFEATVLQDQPKPLIYLGEYRVKPDKVEAFESVIKDFIREMKKYRMPYSFTMYSTSEFTYYSINEFESYGMLDRFNADWVKVENKIGAATMDKYHRIEFGAIHSFKATLLRYKSGYSFVPDISLHLEQKNNFILWTFFYIHPSKKAEWAKFQKKWIEFHKNKNIKMALLSFTGGIGYEMPVWIHKRGSKSRIDYYREIEKIRADFGAEMDVLLKKSFPFIKRVEEVNTFYRPDLSYFPEKK